MTILRAASPNFGPRRNGVTAPDYVMLHYTAMQSAEAAIERLCDPVFEVSAHYVISRCGAVTQLVDESQRAWHAGAGSWAGITDMNSRSIGIELDNCGAAPFSAPLMAALEALLSAILARWFIPVHHVIGHSDYAPGRKQDPGSRFDWRRLALQGLAVRPAIQQAEGQAGPHAGSELLEQALSRIGYDVKEFGLEACLAAFRARFRPGATGQASAADLEIAEAVLQAST